MIEHNLELSFDCLVSKFLHGIWLSCISFSFQFSFRRVRHAKNDENRNYYETRDGYAQAFKNAKQRKIDTLTVRYYLVGAEGANSFFNARLIIKKSHIGYR